MASNGFGGVMGEDVASNEDVDLDGVDEDIIPHETGWFEVSTGRPAAQVILEYLAVEPWKKVKATEGERPECEAVLIRNYDDRTGSDSRETLFSWNTKHDGEDLLDGVNDFMRDHFPADPEALRRRIVVMRNPIPDQHKWDSSRCFVIGTEAYLRKAAEGAERERQAETSGPPQRQVIIERPATGSTPAAPALTGNVQIDAFKMLESTFGFALELLRQESTWRAQRVTLDQRVINYGADLALRSPDARVRAMEIDRDLAMRQMDIDQATHGQMVRDVGGVLVDGIDKMTQNPLGQAIAAKVLKKLGLLDDEDLRDIHP